MAKLRVRNFSVSVDGYGAGANQCLEHPLGVGGEALHSWAFATRSSNSLRGQPGGRTGVDDDMFAKGFDVVGAWIIGRNMFGPDRGPWDAEPWQGWWGENPPFHVPVFVITKHPRPPLVLKGGTEFHFVTAGIEAALQRAMQAAAGKDVRLGGGAGVIRQYLEARLVDELHLALVPTLLGAGETLFEGLNLRALGYSCDGAKCGEGATHILISRAD